MGVFQRVFVRPWARRVMVVSFVLVLVAVLAPFMPVVTADEQVQRKSINEMSDLPIHYFGTPPMPLTYPPYVVATVIAAIGLYAGYRRRPGRFRSYATVAVIALLFLPLLWGATVAVEAGIGLGIQGASDPDCGIRTSQCRVTFAVLGAALIVLSNVAWFVLAAAPVGIIAIQEYRMRRDDRVDTLLMALCEAPLVIPVATILLSGLLSTL